MESPIKMIDGTCYVECVDGLVPYARIDEQGVFTLLYVSPDDLIRIDCALAARGL